MGVKQYNTMCDVYSVGIVIWEIYSRTAPYEGEHYKAVIRDVCNRRINKRPKVGSTALTSAILIFFSTTLCDVQYCSKLALLTFVSRPPLCQTGPRGYATQVCGAHEKVLES